MQALECSYQIIRRLYIEFLNRTRMELNTVSNTLLFSYASGFSDGLIININSVNLCLFKVLGKKYTRPTYAAANIRHACSLSQLSFDVWHSLDPLLSILMLKHGTVG